MRFLRKKKITSKHSFYHDKYSKTKDSLASEEVINSLQKMQMQFDIERLERDNENEMHLLEKEKKILTQWWVLISGALLIVLVLIVILYRKNKQQKVLVETRLKNSQLEKQSLEGELDYKNRELENFALHLVQKNEFIDSIKVDAKELKSGASEKNQDKINALNLKINQSLVQNKELEKFRDRVDEVNSSFFLLLEGKYPSMTRKERRLCALLKLNLSSKEIATLSDVSEGAITMARYRLRKKIGLKPEENLSVFFQKL